LPIRDDSTNRDRKGLLNLAQKPSKISFVGAQQAASQKDLS
jgi:hypothetical protein